MPLEALLEDRKKVRQRFCYLLEQDAKEFDMFLKKRNNTGNSGLGPIKKAVIEKKLNLGSTNHSTINGIITTTFMKGRLNNNSLDYREIQQRIGFTDFGLIKYFIDYLGKEKIIGKLDAAEAVAADSIALFTASSATYSEFTKTEESILRRRRSFKEYYFEKEGKEEVTELCKAFYERLYENWKEEKTKVNGRLQSDNIEHDIAVQHFMNSFNNQDLLKLVCLLKDKEEAKTLKVVDMYVSQLRKDIFNKDLIDFFLNPIPLFRLKAMQPNIDIWSHMGDLNSVRKEELEESETNLKELISKYSDYKVEKAEHIEEASGLISKVNRLMVVLFEYQRIDYLEKAKNLKEHLVNEKTGYSKKLEVWKNTLNENLKYIAGLEKSLGEIFKEDKYTIEDATVIVDGLQEVEKADGLISKIDDESINKLRDQVSTIIEDAKALLANKTEEYKTYITKLMADCPGIIESKKWDTQQEVSELEITIEEVKSAINGAKLLSLETGSLLGLRNTLGRIRNSYNDQLQSNKEDVEKIKKRGDKLYSDMEYRPNAKRYLKLGSNMPVQNLTELRDAMKSGGKPFFSRYVNSSRNKFALWVKESMNDPELYEKLNSTKDYFDALEIIEERLEKGYEIKANVEYAEKLLRLGGLAKEDLAKLEEFKKDDGLKDDVAGCEQLVKDNISGYEEKLEELRKALNSEWQEIEGIVESGLSGSREMYSQDIRVMMGYKERCAEISKVGKITESEIKGKSQQEIVKNIYELINKIKDERQDKEIDLIMVNSGLTKLSDKVDTILALEEACDSYEKESAGNEAEQSIMADSLVFSTIAELYKEGQEIYTSLNGSWRKDEQLDMKIEKIDKQWENLSIKMQDYLSRGVEEFTDQCRQNVQSIDGIKVEKVSLDNVLAYQKMKKFAVDNRPLYDTIINNKVLEVEHAR